MTPLYPLRLLFSAVFSWGLLIGGLYCFWELWQRGDLVDHAAADPGRQIQIAQPDRPSAGDEQSNPIQPALISAPERPLEEWPAWVVLSLAVTATGWSLGGSGLLRLFLGRRGNYPHSLKGTTEVIARPDGTQLHVQTFGNPDGPTLIFTHGWSLDRSGWFYAQSDLNQQFRIVLWDLPGLGQSTAAKNRDQSLEKMARDLDAVVQHVGQGKAVTLVGHSIGGMILQVYSRLYPESLGTRIDAMMMVNTTFKNPLTTMIFSPLLTALQWPLIVPLNYVVIGLAPLAWLSNWKSYFDGSMLFFSRMTSFTGKQTWGQLDHSSLLAARAWPATVARGNLAMFRFDETNTLPTIGVPVLVVAGECDRVTQRRASEYMVGALPQGTLATLPGGHLQLYEYHLLVTDRIRRFMEARLPAPSSPSVKSLSHAAPPASP